MASAIIRPGLLDRLQKFSGIKDEDAFARAIGASRSTLYRINKGEPPSIGFIAGVAKAFGLSLGEVAILADEPTVESDAA